MSQDLVEAFRTANAEFVAADKVVRDMRSLVKRLGDADWNTVIMDNAEPPMSPTSVALTRNSVSIDGRKWPTANQVSEALCNLHSTRVKAREAHGLIPDDLRRLISFVER